jgi:Leucine-rich repeat (LRR) protein
VAGFAGQPVGERSPISDEVVRAWKKAGADFGWTKVNDRDLPTFTFSEWKQEVLRNLPAPALPFGLDLSNTPATDAALTEISDLENLHALYLGGTEVTNAGLKNLARLKRLRILDVCCAKVTGAGLKELAGLELDELVTPDFALNDVGLKHYLAVVKSPTWLNLNGNQVTDAGLEALPRAATLRGLDLSVTMITDAGLKHIAGLVNLETLNLNTPDVTDAGLKELIGLKRLQRLILRDTELTDAGLEHVARLKSLMVLDLEGTNVTEAGVRKLAALEKLRVLRLGRTQIAGTQAVEELRKALPRCKIAD